MTDSQGNLLRIPKPTLISLVFSFLSMSKAIYSINVVKGIQFKVRFVRLLIQSTNLYVRLWFEFSKTLMGDMASQTLTNGTLLKPFGYCDST